MVSRLVIGGYTTGAGGGLGVVQIQDGGFGQPTMVAEAANPSFVVASPDGRFLYAVLEGEEGTEGRVAAWAVGSDEGPWTALGGQATGGSSPCHLALSPDGGHVAVASYSSGSVSVHSLAADGSVCPRMDLVTHEGSLGPVEDRQGGAHAHQVVFGPAGHLFVCDLGLDAVIAYELDPRTGRLAEVARSAFAPGTGPRHLAFAPGGRTAWVLGELASTVSVCEVDGPRLQATTTISSRATAAPTTTVAAAGGENLAAAIAVSADGREVHVSNRGDDTISTFSVEAASLRLAAVSGCGGHWPRHLLLGPEPATAVVSNERSGELTLLVRDGEGWASSGRVDWPAPTCVAVLP